MKELNPTVSISSGGSDLGLHKTVSIDGHTIVDKKADSILGPFVKALYRLICQPEFNDSQLNKERFVACYQRNRSATHGPGVTVNTSVVPNELDATGTSKGEFDGVYDYMSNSRHNPDGSASHLLLGIDAEDPLLSGVFISPRNVDRPNTLPLKRVTSWGKDALPENVEPVDLSGQNPTVDRIKTIPFRLNRSESYNSLAGRSERVDYDLLRAPTLHIGKDNRPNEMNYFFAGNSDFRFSTTGDSNSTPANSANQSVITFSRDFTNNSGSAITVENIHISTHATDDRRGEIVIARDLNQFTIPDSSTVTVQYKMTADNTGGGLMEMFMGLLTRRFNNGHEVSRINGTSAYRENHYLEMMAHPIEGVDADYGQGMPNPENMGPVLGTDGSAVVNGQEKLKSKIPHGRKSGELVHLGTTNEPLEIDEANDEMEFGVTRHFKNESGSSVDVQETALYVGGGGDDGDYRDFPRDSYMVARHASPSATIADGEIAKLTYTFKADLA
jgi:hypothetical protein